MTITGPARPCAWCSEPIPARARRDSVCCSVRCRQARHRFLRAAGYAESVTGLPLRLAYADPPYPGNAWLYRDHPDYAGEVDHAALIASLAAYDGWALSTSAEALPAVLVLCPPGVRVAAWHRGERPTPGAWPLHAWEPVIYCGGRQLPRPAPCRLDRVRRRARDHAPDRPGDRRQTPRGVPVDIRLPGRRPADTLDHLFPGSGAVTRAWAAFTRQPEAVASGSG